MFTICMTQEELSKMDVEFQRSVTDLRHKVNEDEMAAMLTKYRLQRAALTHKRQGERNNMEELLQQRLKQKQQRHKQEVSI